MRQLRVPIPIPALSHVNVYLLRDGDAAALVDAGMESGETHRALLESLGRLGLGPCDLDFVAVTHFHVDHITLLPRLLSQCPVPAYLGRRDLEVVRAGFEQYFLNILKLYADYGAPGDELERIRRSHYVTALAGAYEALASSDLRPLAEGDELRVGGSALRVVELPGHTPGHVGLLAGGAALVGDAVLAGITPHVVLDRPDRDALGEYLATLARLARMRGVRAYAGHGAPVDDLGARAAEIIAHHESRLREVLGLLRSRGPMTAYDVARRVRWRTRARSWEEMTPYERYFAIGEALAHLRRLESEGLAAEVGGGAFRAVS